ncbi:MAG: hypothetical protein ACRDPA_16410 [Solirubrobacteraceae bacterium]
MSRFKFHRPSPALAIALVALFVALGGSAVAATTLLIHTKNIANGAVTNHKLANGAVGLAKLNTHGSAQRSPPRARAGESSPARPEPPGPPARRAPQGRPARTAPTG